MNLKHDKFGTIRTTEIKGERYYVARDVCRALGYKERGYASAVKGRCKSEIKAKINNAGQTLSLIPISDVVNLIKAARIADAQWKTMFAEFIGTAQNSINASREEIEFFGLLRPIIQGFGLTFIQQYNLSPYRIDAYIPEIKLAIEFDENDHKRLAYSPEKELERETYIINKLDCQIIRVSDKILTGEALSLIINKTLTLKASHDIIIL